MSMTKKDYELIAKELRAQHELLGFHDGVTGGGQSVYKTSCVLWAKTLGDANPRFNREMFLAACGIHD